MPTALLFCPASSDPAATGQGGADPTILAADLRHAGLDMLRPPAPSLLLRDVIEAAPDIVIVHDRTPERALFDATAALGEAAPRPVVVFTRDGDPEKMARAVRSGIHAYVVDGYSRNRLPGIVQLAQARFRHEQLLRQELAGVKERFAERKLVDRARGILMNTRRLREDEAYAALRTAAMHTKQRIGQVSQQVIDGASYAESVNRAGQLRMLSQRLVLQYALCCTGEQPEAATRLSEAVAQVEANLLVLGRTLPARTFGGLLDQVVGPWRELRRAVALPATPDRIPQADDRAEEMLLRAETLTENVETAGFVLALHVVNVSGRQRMLSQRYAKLLLMGGDEAGLLPLRERIEERMVFLDELPMTNATISHELTEARVHWAALLAVPSPDDAGPAARVAIAATSDALLACFERLTDYLERAVQVLAG